MPRRHVYLDSAAATPVDPRVISVVTRAMRDLFANPSGFHSASRKSATALAQSRQQTARFLGCHSDEIIFTASSSEANTLALRGIQIGDQPIRSMAVSVVEHPSVLAVTDRMSQNGARVEQIAVDSDGKVLLDEVASAITRGVELISVMMVNNETGTIQPIREIARLIHMHRKSTGTPTPYLHIDASQAAAWMRVGVEHLGVDLMTVSSSKVYGPHGVGLLYVRRGITINPIIPGGNQEDGRRGGTANVPGIVGFAKAIRLIRPTEAQRVQKLRSLFLKGITAHIPDAIVYGMSDLFHAPHVLAVSIPGCDAQQLLIELDRMGVAAGAGAACTIQDVRPSHVLKAMGVSDDLARSTIRFSLSRWTTREDVRTAVAALAQGATRLQRRYSNRTK